MPLLAILLAIFFILQRRLRNGAVSSPLMTCLRLMFSFLFLLHDFAMRSMKRNVKKGKEKEVEK